MKEILLKFSSQWDQPIQYREPRFIFACSSYSDFVIPTTEGISSLYKKQLQTINCLSPPSPKKQKNSLNKRFYRL
jgi:hypothetical protein